MIVDTAVIIASWNGKEYLKDCFETLANQTYQGFKTIFVDNGSKDGSVDFVKGSYPETEIVQLEKNAGFAFPYNLGISGALKDGNIEYVIVLNNDTKLHEKFLEEIVNCAKKNSETGSIQSKVLNFFEKNKLDCTGIVFSADGVAVNRGYGEIDSGRYDGKTDIFGANGTASLFTRTALEKTKLSDGEFFDNSYFAYHEDVDLAWRMRLAGFKSYYCPKAIAYHVHSATAGRISGFKAYYLNRNRFFTLIKNYPVCRLVLVLCILTPVRYIFLLFRVIMNKGRKDRQIAGQKKSTAAKEILRSWGGVIANVPSLLKKRRIIRKYTKVGRGEIRSWFGKYAMKFLKTF